MRGLTMRNVREGDEGLYTVRVTGPGVNLYSSCRVSLSRASTSGGGGGEFDFVLLFMMINWLGLARFGIR